MPPLPALSGREVAQTFVSLGWEIARRRGSHIVLVEKGPWPHSLYRTIEPWPREHSARSYGRLT